MQYLWTNLYYHQPLGYYNFLMNAVLKYVDGVCYVLLLDEQAKVFSMVSKTYMNVFVHF